MMTYEERSLLLLEPCCVHIHRQHGGGSLRPQTSQRPECGRWGQGVFPVRNRWEAVP